MSRLYQIINYFLGFSLLIGFFIIFYDYRQPLSDPIQFIDHSPTLAADNIQPASLTDDGSSTSNQNTIHLSGAVANPNDYQLPPGSTIQDAIDLAGGLTNQADIRNVNIGTIVYDGQQIDIPALDIEEPAFAIASSNSNDSSKININTATKEQLLEISGVGESTAQKIIDYRSQNRFDNIEELMEVKGIGEKTFAKLKDEIIV